jgi:mannose-6-phosphate isomerase-like protein (cupin superfamily)
MNYHLTMEGATALLAKEKEQVFTVLLRHGSMQVEYFIPKDHDRQKPHRQDEIYVIASGQSRFFRDGEYLSCKANDVLFVPAGMVHRFEDFSDDFATWVIFYGQDGGEAIE